MFASPLYFAAQNSSPGLGVTDFLGIAIWILAIGGESLADRQLAAFKSDPENRGGVCRRGLWAWSRHPNYFFEWTHWFAYVLIGWNAPNGWLSLLGPIIMRFFLVKITGIPPTETRALEGRGAEYRRYQREVSAFLPLPPRVAP